ncbi:MAG TPA: ribosome-associated translation inhibitor RaiA [Gammaproteobacteria bacterium]|nr:ribosome-associated translation inhibitor RaiA [Gammaproteobacteria bacterium]
MNITFTAHHCDSSQPLESYAAEKFEKILKHSDYKVVDAKVTFSVDNLNKIAQASLSLPQKRRVFATTSSTDMYASIDKLVAKIDAQVRRIHSKGAKHRDHGDS